MGCLWILAVLLGRQGRHHREPRHGVPSGHHPRDAVAERDDPDGRVRGLPDDVRDHHAGPDHGRLHQSGDIPCLHALPDRLAGARLLPICPHDLGRWTPRGNGRPRFRRWDCGSCDCRYGCARVGRLRRSSTDRGCGTTQHSARGARHRSPLVRLVRVQCGQRVPGGFGHGDRVPEHGHRGFVRRHRLARAGCVLREATEIPGAPDRRRSRAGDDHPRGGLCVARDGDHHRLRRRGRLLRRRGAQESLQAGRRPRRVGGPRGRRFAGDRSPRDLRLQGLEPGRRRRTPRRQCLVLPG